MYGRVITLTMYRYKEKLVVVPRNTNAGQSWGLRNTNIHFRLYSFVHWFVEDALTNEFQFSATGNSGCTSIIEFKFVSQTVSRNRQICEIVNQFC